MSFKTLKSLFSLPICLLFCFFPLLTGASTLDEGLLNVDNNVSPENHAYEVLETVYLPAEVLSVSEAQVSVEGGDNLSFVSVQKVKLELKKGEWRGEIVEINNELASNPLDMKVKTGERLMLQIDLMKDGQRQYFLMDYYRVPTLWLIAAIFIGFLLILGGWKGLKTLLALLFSVLLIFYWFIPLTLSGKNPLWAAVGVAALGTVLAIYLIGGRSKKSVAAILGTLAGIGVALLFTYIFSKLAYLNGLSGEDSRALFAAYPNINPLPLFFSAILIGAMGAVMDSAMSVASAISELKKNMPNAPFSILLKTGMAVGRDVMGTMTDTLILAYVGVSLPMLVLYYGAGSGGVGAFLNFDFVAEEIVRSIGGTLGLIASIPLTAVIAAKLESHHFKK
ncbi:MAG TPA: YibE/F family protein [bacterium]|mgnify:CR=1 FL=1|nr:YibE/F family protein [bacterium]